MDTITSLCEIARRAGAEILRVYERGSSVDYKKDSSPLTDADRASHELICSELPRVLPGTVIISEESENLPSGVPNNTSFWLVDPLDGTKEFIKRTGDFTVNIALISDGSPAMGIVYAPARDWMYFAEVSKGAWKTNGQGRPAPLRTRKADPGSLCLVASKDHAGPEVEKLFQKLPGAQLANMGSSLKFCLVAEGSADFYPRFGPTMEWDTAAAHCVLQTAGGDILNLQGEQLRYNKPEFRNGPFVAIGDPSLEWRPWI